MNYLIGRNPQLNLKRTASYLNYVQKSLPRGVCLPPPRVDQFRLYLADPKRSDLDARERSYAERCWLNVSVVYAAMVDEALQSPAPMNSEDIAHQSNSLLRTAMPYAIIASSKSAVSPAVRRRVCFFERGKGWIGIFKKDRI